MQIAEGRAVALFVDHAVLVASFTADLDVSFVNANRTAMGSAKLAQPFLDHRQVGKDPSVDRAVIHCEAAVSEDLLQIAVAQRIAQVLVNGLNSEPTIEMPPFEVVP